MGIEQLFEPAVVPYWFQTLSNSGRSLMNFLLGDEDNG